MVLSRVARRAAQRAVATTTSAAGVDRKTDSFAFGVMQGTVNTDHMFPYPNVLNEEHLEMLEAMIDPFESVCKNYKKKTEKSNSWENFIALSM